MRLSISTSPATPKAGRPARPRLRAWQAIAACLVVIIVAEAAGALFLLIRNRANCGGSQATSPAVRVLFIGNSYTAVNNLPTIFAKLACSGGHRAEVSMVANGGWTLANHLASPDTQAKLTEQKWDFVVLQEQSQIPAQEAARTSGMYPAARQLVGQINGLGARPIFFMTWGHANGWPESGLPNYDAMQAQLAVGYLGIAQELHAAVAPVGTAWSATRALAPDLQLWQDDGSHPSGLGTYLAACVFYAALFGQSPVGLAYTEDMPASIAAKLQQIAADTVLTEPQRWNLP